MVNIYVLLLFLLMCQISRVDIEERRKEKRSIRLPIMLAIIWLGVFVVSVVIDNAIFSAIVAFGLYYRVAWLIHTIASDVTMIRWGGVTLWKREKGTGEERG